MFSSTWSYFGPCHIFSVVWTAILSILLILSFVSTFVFKSSAKMRVSALTKSFLLLSSPINSSKSSCRRLVKFSRKSKTPSVESVSIYPVRYCPISLRISSKISVASTVVFSTSICSKLKRLSLDVIKIFLEQDF